MIPDIAPGWGSAPPAPDTTFGDALRQIRTARRMSQSRLADRAGKDHSYLSRLESGERWPSRDAIEAIAGALELTRSERDTLLLAGGFAPSWATRQPIQDVVAQRALFGNPGHIPGDWELNDWTVEVSAELSQVIMAGRDNNPDAFRYALIRVAATALMAVEAIDRPNQEREAA